MDPERHLQPARIPAPAVHYWLWDLSAIITSGNSRSRGLAYAPAGDPARVGLVCTAAVPGLQPALHHQNDRQTGTPGMAVALAGHLGMDLPFSRACRRRPMGQPALPRHPDVLPGSPCSPGIHLAARFPRPLVVAHSGRGGGFPGTVRLLVHQP